ncbi:MAG: DNA primase noncatalytic subunit PriX [Candidatus Micrarchaeota archaeon]|nr:DNA primase noncatalytic subunit PriX [Candidatus Micrarchaeota archaeon]MDE1824309.1 DNA primase noncatalytic subunit PriX [Candidatus Micrarchaeota archaeon]MDE1849744.1 DNA primase noncatalytic subunit PriX [Candidatus Micrarchaeota archaeon]
MADLDRDALDFAYRYPFSSEARSILSSMDQSVSEKYLQSGRVRLEEDLKSQRVQFTEVMLDDVKKTYILSYVYSRMLVSAINNRYYIGRYIRAEAARFGSALAKDSVESVLKVAKETLLNLSYSDGLFSLGFADFLMFAPKSSEFSLIRHGLSDGCVRLPKESTCKVMEGAIAELISRNLPIKLKELPKKVVDYSRLVKVPAEKAVAQTRVKGNYAWIETVLQNPIADVRHRAVNLILAPYLVNVRGLDEESAARIITGYIEKCKMLNPDTRINETYIKYQCRYAREKKMRPLSLDKAREMFKGILALEK